MPLRPTTFEIIRPCPLPQTKSESRLMKAIETEGATSIRAISQIAKMSLPGVMNLATRLSNRGLVRIVR